MMVTDKPATTTSTPPKAKRTLFRWTQETSSRACVMRKEGRTNAAICEELGCLNSTLNGLFAKLKKAGIDVPRAIGWRQALDLKQLGLIFEKKA